MRHNQNKGLKLKDFLQAKYPDLSARVIKRALEQGACKVNGKIERFATRRINPEEDKISYTDIRPKAVEKLVIDPQRIVFEDEFLIVYNKEAGHPSLATEGQGKTHLLGELNKFLVTRDGQANLQAVHRIDKNTSGLLIFAKTLEATRKFNELFQDKEISKSYDAILDGVLEGEGRILSYMRLAKQGQGWQRWEAISEAKAQVLYQEYLDRKKEKGEDANISFENFLLRKKYKTAISRYKVIKAYPSKSYTHVVFMPETGRTHQLRLQAKGLGHPILGDSFYSESFRCNLLPERHLLHASGLELKHPYTFQKLSLRAELAEDIRSLIQ